MAEREGPPVPIAGIVAVLLVAGAVFVQLAPLSTSRPSSTPRIKSRVANVQDVDTRLWQDPLGAVDQHQEQVEAADKSAGEAVKRGEAPPRPPHWRRHQLEDLALQVSGGADVGILAVMMFGGPHVEDAEFRRRTRYAVVSGLVVAGFTPDDSERIGYFVPAGGGGAVRMPGGGQRQLPEIIPYEWFEREKSRLLLLWLDESAFLNNPLANLNDLVGQLTTRTESPPKGAARNPARKARLKLIGPVSSTTLDEMIKEARTATPRWPHLGDSQILSTATASDDRLMGTPKAAAETLDKHKIKFARLIGRDSDLMVPLLQELELRGIDFTAAPESHRIVLISESDTLYGRTLPKLVTEKVCERSRRQCRVGPDGRFLKPDWVATFSYFRGLDGVLPQSAKKEDAGATAKSDGGDKPKEPESSERAEQDSQVDYLRRLAGRIKTLDDDWRRAYGLTGGGIRAVGVLGSDFYDKLLVLRAIRRQLPDAVFFTTDLDARLLEPREFRWTRNLVVVSSFGLELHPGLQENVPPFRDSYQTATFFTTRMLLDSPAPMTRLESCILETPRAFEIGRRVAFDLSCAPWDRACVPQSPAGCLSIHPDPHPFFPTLGSSVLLLTGLAGLALLLGYTASTHVRKLARDIVSCFRWNRTQWPVFCTTLLATAGVVLALGIAVRKIVETGRGGEPFSLTYGISIWPTEIIRLVAAACAVAFLVQGWRVLRQNTAALHAAFFAPATPSPAPPLEAASMWQQVKAAYAVVLGYRPDQTVPVAAELWRDYRRDGTLLSRGVRVLSIAVVYLAAGTCVVLATGLVHVPYRGALTARIDRAVLVISVMLLIVLIIAVTDAIRLGVRVTRALSKQTPTVWPEDPALRAFRAQLGWPDPPTGQAPDNLGLDRWIDIQFIARLTSATGQLIYFPFIVLFLMIVSRLAWFDDWNLPLGLIIVLTVSLFYCIACAAVMRHWAETARREAIAYLTRVFIRLKADAAQAPSGHDKLKQAQGEQLKLMIDEITKMEDGAFAPFTKQPVVRALAAAFGGAGGLGIAQYFALGWL